MAKAKRFQIEGDVWRVAFNPAHVVAVMHFEEEPTSVMVQVAGQEDSLRFKMEDSLEAVQCFEHAAQALADYSCGKWEREAIRNEEEERESVSLKIGGTA